MHARTILPGETHALRQQLLRPGRPISEMEWPLDNDPGTFHVGVEHEGKIIAVATFQPQPHERLHGNWQFRLRGMATEPAYQGKGVGRELVRFGLNLAKQRMADQVWCLARVNALDFYGHCGFRDEGTVMLISGIGVHHLMYHLL